MELPVRKQQNLAEVFNRGYLNSQPTSSSRINKVKLSTSRCPATLGNKDHLIVSSFSSPEDQDGLLLQIPYPQDLQWSPVNQNSNFILTNTKEHNKVPIGSTPEEHFLGPPGPSLNAEVYFHPLQSWSLAWGVTKVHTSPRSSTLT